MIGWAAFIAYMVTVPLANWLIDNVGTHCIADGPCVVPVWVGIYCPSGSLIIGLGLVLRDIVQRAWGAHASLAAIVAGTVLAALVAPASLVIASATAFAISELADFAIYTPLYQKRFVTAIIISSTVGLVIDSALFLWLAFGSLELLDGLVLGKFWMVVVSMPVMFLVRSHFARTA